MTADQLAVLAFEAALDRNAWLWGQLCRLEQLVTGQLPGQGVDGDQQDDHQAPNHELGLAT